MNTRREAFQDWRVRDAMLHAFNFESINNAMTDGKQPRITSYYSNAPFYNTTRDLRGHCLHSGTIGDQSRDDTRQNCR